MYTNIQFLFSISNYILNEIYEASSFLHPLKGSVRENERCCRVNQNPINLLTHSMFKDKFIFLTFYIY